MFTLNPDVNYEIFKNLDYDQIIQYCTTSKTIKDMCNDDRLWEYLYKHHFPNIPHIDLKLSWKDSYRLTYLTIFNTVDNIVTNVNAVIPKYLNKQLLIKDITQIIVDFFSKQTSNYIDEDDYSDLRYIIGDLSLGVGAVEILDSYPLERRVVFPDTFRRTSADNYIDSQLYDLFNLFAYNVGDDSYISLNDKD